MLLLLFSCSDDSTNPSTDSRFKKVFGLFITYENGQIGSQIGDVSKNACNNVNNVFSIIPNPAYSSVSLHFNIESKRSVEIFIETALGSKEFNDSLRVSNYSFLATQEHDKYYKESIYKGELNSGTHEILLNLDDYEAGIYYISIIDNEGITVCTPLVIYRTEDKISSQ